MVAGALAFAAWEGLWVAFGARLAPGPIGVLGLVALSALPATALGLIAMGACALLPVARRPGGAAAWWVGVLAAGLFSLAAWWTLPALPFVEPMPGHGSPWAFIVVALGGAVAGAGLLGRASERTRRLAAAALVALGVASLVATAWPAPRGGHGPRILLITLDGARADRFVDARIDTTASNRIGREGVTFARAYAQLPYTGPSTAGLLAGSTPWVHGVWGDGVALPPDVPTLAEVLRAAGYDTGAFVGSARQGRGLGLDRGFRVYDDDLDWVIGARHLPIGRMWTWWRRGPGAWPTTRRADEVVDRAVRWMARRTRPYLAWVQLGEGHPPHRPPHPFDLRYAPEGGPSDGDLLPSGVSAQWARAQYDGSIASADAQIGRLLDRLEAWGQLDDTLVVVTAPHGLTLGEGGRWLRHDGITDAELRVPLMARWPAGIPAARVVAEPAEVADVAPTILGWIGLSPPSVWDGRSWSGGGLDGEAPRSLARSAAYDPEAEPPGRRITVVRNRRYGWVHAEDPARRSGFLHPTDPADPEGRALLGDLMAERARELLVGWEASGVRRPALSPEAARWLAAQDASFARAGVP